MRVLTPGRLCGLGLGGPPVVWAAFHVAGFSLTQARCNTAGEVFALDAWTIAIGAAAAALIAAGIGASLLAFRRTRHEGNEPPVARIHFLSVMGLTVAPLLLVITVMETLGVVFLNPCVQS